MFTNRTRRRMAGLTLIELVMFIIVVSIGVAGILQVLNVAVRSSSDPMRRKQAIAIAESLLTEIEQQPFTYCDPNDPNMVVANSTGMCSGGAAGSQDKNGGALGMINFPTTTAETRGSTTVPFDNVSDYAGYTQTNVTDIIGANTMAGYTSVVTITRAGSSFAQTPITVPNDAALKISVTVISGSDSVTLVGYRLRYAPNAAG